MVTVVDAIVPGDLISNETFATVRTYHGTKTVFVVQEDYYESGGVCYSGIGLTVQDLEQLLALLRA